MTGLEGAETTGAGCADTAFDTVGFAVSAPLPQAAAATAHTVIRAANCMTKSPE